MKRFLVLVAALSACSPKPAPQPPAIPPVDPEAVSPRNDAAGTIVHLFEWTWPDVAEECEAFLGPAGYTAVQVSPVVENHVVVGRPWWERYQPVSYRLDTRSGDRAAFADMVSRCRAAGVEVMVDVILNHMADADLRHDSETFTGRGTAGTTFGSYDYPGLFTPDDFHRCGLTPDDNIADWDDPAQVWNCELVDLSDLDTSQPDVREKVGAYLADLVSLGVTEFRVDTARHLSPEDLEAILAYARVRYAALEVTHGGWIGYYLPIAPVINFTYGPMVSRVFRGESLATLGSPEFWASDPHPTHSAVVFLSNHDNQRGHGVGEGVLTFKDGALYDLASAYTLASGRGRPRVMSSYAFESGSQGPPTGEGESIARVHGETGIGCGTGWICEHRRPIIAGFVGFEAAVRGAAVERFAAEGPDRFAFARGASGFAAFNRSAEAWQVTLDTGLEAGTWCDAAQGPAAPDGSCPGAEVAVDEAGRASVTVPALGAVGLFRPRPGA